MSANARSSSTLCFTAKSSIKSQVSLMDNFVSTIDAPGSPRGTSADEQATRQAKQASKWKDDCGGGFPQHTDSFT